MTLQSKRISITFDYISVAAYCLCAVTLGNRFPASLLCVILHELGHITVLCLQKTKHIDITLRCMSIDIIDREKLSRTPCRLAAVALSGPLVNLICVPIFYGLNSVFDIEFFKNSMIFSAVLCVFNLIPVESTDGGEIMQIILGEFISPRGISITMTTLSAVFMTPVCIASFYVLINSKSNFTLLAAVLCIIASIVNRV